MTRPDAEILRDIQAQLMVDASIDADGLKVTVHDGVVHLTGVVTDYDAYQAAQKDAWIVRGVTGVVDQVRIEYPTDANMPTDSEIRNRVLNVLEWNPAIDAANIEVSVVNGEATLSGTVDAFWQKERAVNLAYTVAGVVRTNDNLEVALESRYADDQVRSDIIASFRRALFLDADRIDVAVRDGFVTLGGTVPDWHALRVAADLVCHLAGVRGIQSDITIAEVPARV